MNIAIPMQALALKRPGQSDLILLPEEYCLPSPHEPTRASPHPPSTTSTVDASSASATTEHAATSATESTSKQTSEPQNTHRETLTVTDNASQERAPSPIKISTFDIQSAGEMFDDDFVHVDDGGDAASLPGCYPAFSTVRAAVFSKHMRQGMDVLLKRKAGLLGSTPLPPARAVIIHMHGGVCVYLCCPYDQLSLHLLL